MANVFDTHKTRMTGLPCGEETDNILSRFRRIPECDGQTDRQTDSGGWAPIDPPPNNTNSS